MDKIENLYLTYRIDLYRYLLWLSRDSSLSEDLLQETFIKALRSIFTFRGEADIRTWLFKIAKNTWLDHIKKKSNRPTSELLEQMYSSDDLALWYDNKELLEKVEEILNGLDVRTGQILKMRFMGYSFSEISVSLKLNESSCRVLDFRARSKLKQLLEEENK